MTNEQFIFKLETYKNMVYRLAITYLKNVQDAEDITQDVFMKLLKLEKEFPSEEDGGAWLVRVTVNTCKDLVKSAWRRRNSPLHENLVFHQKEQSDLFHAVMSVGLKYRTVVHLYYYEDYSVREISDILHIKETTVQTRLHRVRGKLQQILEKEYSYGQEGYYEKGLQGNLQSDCNK